jgi:HD-like signal output (HDOD) protein/CheY-like chemotaxis protein
VRRILFVDDEPRILDGLQRLLRPRRHEWEMRFALGPAAAVTAMQADLIDVIVTDMRMPEMDGAMLLEHVMHRWPSTVRIVLSGQTDVAATARTVRVAHQFLSKPCDPGELYTTIERLCDLRELLGDASLREAVGTVETLPCVPHVYAQLERALADNASGLPAIAAIVERDTGLSAKLLQLVNSSFFGRPRRVVRVEQAVGLLGMNVLRSLVLSHEIVNSLTAQGAATVVSLEAEQSHALLTGEIARNIIRGDIDADAGFMAGMLHDMGKLLLAARFPEYLRQVMIDATAEQVPGFEIEFARRGASHAEVGAYLLGLWGLPFEVVAAVAFHHRPADAPPQYRDIVTAVHVADALGRELTPASRGGTTSLLNQAWLESVGGWDAVPEWRQTARDVFMRQ